MMLKPLVLACCLALAGCATTIPAAPAEIADSTVLDEQAALAAELAYKAARLAVETGVDAGVISGDRATRIAEADRKAYAALLRVRAAYQAGNAASYSAALTEAQAAISTMIGA